MPETPDTAASLNIGGTPEEQPGVQEQPNVEEHPGVQEQPNVEEHPGVQEQPNVEEHPGVQEQPNVEEHPDVEENPGVQQEEQHDSNITVDEGSSCCSSFCCLKWQGATFHDEPYGCSPTLTTQRELLLSSPVELKRGIQKQDRHLFLYEDILIIAKTKYNNTYQIKYKVRLSDLWISTCTQEVEERNCHSDKTFVLGWPIVNFVATFRSADEKEIWLIMLQRYIDIEREKDFPKVLSLKLITKNIDNCAKFKTLNVKNSETVIDVIKTSLSELGLIGTERDYQLWIHTGKLAAPYLLVGHEIPYSIQISHVRSNLGIVVPTTEDITFIQPPLLTRAHLRPRSRCQFILTPTPRTPALTKNGHRNVLRQRSVLNWSFWRRPNTQLDDGSDSATGKLFGISLPNICKNGNLPTPILNILWLLYERGPLTEGIFRQSASVKACRELKEKLNAGTDVQIYCEPLFVVVSVFQDFLRSIPGSLLSSNMFEIWLSIMDEANPEERIRTIQLLLQQLPRDNITVLRYLFGVLHCIEQNSSINQMNALNLAMCIAPSILGPPRDTPKVEKEIAEKISKLIQFMIENCFKIFGEAIICLFGEVSKPYHRRKTIPDCLQKSYNSVENEHPYVMPWYHGEEDTPDGDPVLLSNPPLESHSKLPSGKFKMKSPNGARCQQQSSEPTLSTELCLKESVPQESRVASAVAHAMPFANAHHGDHTRDSSGGTLVRSLSSRLSLCLEPVPETLHTLPEDIRGAQPSEPTTAGAPSPMRRQRSFSEPALNSLRIKWPSWKELYPKKFRCHSCDSALSPPQRDCLNQKSPGNAEKQCLERDVTGLVGLPKNKPLHQLRRFSKSNTGLPCESISTRGSAGDISVVPESRSSSPAPTEDTQRNRRSSEPSTGSQPCDMTDSREPQPPKKKDTSRWQARLHSLQPGTWIRRTLASFKIWSLSTTARTNVPEENSTLRETSSCPEPTTSEAAQEAHGALQANVPVPCGNAPREGGDSGSGCAGNMPQETSHFNSVTEIPTEDTIPSPDGDKN